MWIFNVFSRSKTRQRPHSQISFHLAFSPLRLVNSMWLLVLKCLLLCTLMKESQCCSPVNFTLQMENSECDQCVVINTTICSGFCYTQDTNLRGRFGRKFLVQRSCLALSLVYHPIHLPGCPLNGTHLFYPVAKRCSCRRCDTRTHHCVQTGQMPRVSLCSNYQEDEEKDPSIKGNLSIHRE